MKNILIIFIIIWQIVGKSQEKINLQPEEVKSNGFITKMLDSQKIYNWRSLNNIDSLKVLNNSRLSDNEVITSSNKNSNPQLYLEFLPEKEIETWNTDVNVFTTSAHEKSPTMTEIADAPYTPEIIIAAEKWNSTTSPDNIVVRKSSDHGGNFPFSPTITIDDSKPLSLPKIAQISSNNVAISYARQYSSSDNDVYLAIVDKDLNNFNNLIVDASGTNHIRPYITSDYHQYPSDPYLYIAYYQYGSSTSSIMFKYSSDQGTTWSSPITISTFTSPSYPYLSMTFGSNRLAIAYTIRGSSSDDIAVTYSPDFGGSWSVPDVIASTSKDETYPEITISSSNTFFIIYEYAYSSTDHDIYYSYTDNGGSTWHTNLSLVAFNSDERYPSVRDFLPGSVSDVYAGFVNIGTNEVRIYKGDYLNPTIWQYQQAANSTNYTISNDDPISLLPKYSPTGESGVGVAWPELHGSDYDIYFDASWLQQILQYSVTTSPNPSSGGSTSGDGTYNVGQTVTVTATANTGYTFTNWTEGSTVVSTSASYQFTMPNNNRSLVANFTPIQRTVTTSSNPSNGGTTTGGGTYNVGQTVTVTATANTGYTFTNWTEGSTVVSTSASYQFTMPNNNRSLVANFTPIQRTVTTSSNPSNGGTTTGGGTYNVGQTVTVTATANTGYTFTNWTEGSTVVSTSASYQFTMPNNNRSLVANFTPIQRTVTTSSNPSNGGTTTGGGTYNVGQTVTVTATANTGYTFTNWTEGSTVVSTSASYQFTMPNNNRSLVANFTLTVPLPPSNLTASAQSSTQINLSWTDNASNETGFKIERKTDSGGTWDQIATVGANVNTYSDDSLVTNSNYFYRINAYNAAGDSPWSNEANATVTGIDMLNMTSGIPDQYSLFNNYPNPFNPSTRIQFGLPEESNSTLKVYDILGSEVITLLDNETLSAGSYSYNLVADGLPSGIYIYVLTTKSNSSQKEFRDIKKMILLK